MATEVNAYSDADVLAAKYEIRSQEAKSLCRLFARDTGDFITDAARVGASKNIRTGKLIRNIQRSGVTRIGDNYSVSVGVGATVPYARFVEYGTGLHIDPRLGTPHFIFPKSAKMMRWVERGLNATPYAGSHGIFSIQTRGQRGGVPSFNVYARKTKGQKGVHFMEHAFEAADKVYVPAKLRELGIEITR